MDGLRTRIITGSLFSIVMLAGILLGSVSFLLLFALVSILCQWEFLGLALTADGQWQSFRRLFYTLLGSLPYWLVVLYQNELLRGDQLISAAVTLMLCWSLTFLFELFRQGSKPFADLGSFALSIIYINVPFAMLAGMGIRDGVYQLPLVTGLLLLTWANDSGAYFAGSRLGKHKLLPRISPKKTWEGAFGGLLFTLLVAAGLGFWWGGGITIGQWLVIGTLVVVFGSLGDLVESLLKRSMAIKDSGSLLPGHGGFLDRFDGFLFHLPWVAAYLWWVFY